MNKLLYVIILLVCLLASHYGRADTNTTDQLHMPVAMGATIGATLLSKKYIDLGQPWDAILAGSTVFLLANLYEYIDEGPVDKRDIDRAGGGVLLGMGISVWF